MPIPMAVPAPASFSVPGSHLDTGWTSRALTPASSVAIARSPTTEVNCLGYNEGKFKVFTCLFKFC
jgi:hypothetical protein